MTKTKRTIRAIIALVMAIVMVGSVIPTMAYAADAADSLENQLDQSATFLEKVTTAIYNFFQRIINFFRNLFGKGDEEPEPEVPDDNKVEVGDEEALKAVLKDGGKVYLAQNFDCKGGESIVIPGNVSVTIYLQGNTIKNPVSGKPAIINKGELTIYGDGAVINGANDVSGSHTILNTGTLVINGGNIGTDYTAGAAVINDGGFVTINGGTYASRQEAVEGDSRSVYAFVNEKGTMVVNNANLEGRTHGLFAAYAGDLIVNGGMYKMDGNGGLGCYVAYAEDSAEVLLIGGIVHTNNPRSNRVFYVSDNGDKFDADAVATDNITYVGTEIYLNGVKQDYSESTPWTVSGGTLYLKDVTITAKEGNALTVKDDTKIIIDGNVKLIGAKDGAGIFVESNARLEITGSGSLTVIGNEGKEYDTNKYYCEGNYTDFAGTGGSGIAVASGAMLVVDGLNELTAEGYGVHAFGLGGNGAIVKIEDSTIKYVRGGFVNVTGKYYDEKYNKSEPEGGAAIGGSDIGILKSHIIKAEGGSKAAGIGAQFHKPANITIRFSEIDKVVGGSSSAGIGGSRIPSEYSGQDIKIIIEDSKISAYGGYYGAGIGSGYDTHCTATDKAPMHTIYIKGNSEINATGGKYAAGIGTGYHVANLKGEIETTVKVTAQSGEKFYKAAYTRAQDVGFGVVDPDREGKNNYSTFKYMGIEFGIPEPINPVTALSVTEKLDLMLDGVAKAIEVTITPTNATITGKSFISSDESVATVDATGIVTPIALGKATISVTVASNDGSIKTAETAVIVRSENGAYPVASTADINEAIKAGEKNIILVDDIALTTSIEIAEGAKVSIDGNGHTIARVAGGEAAVMINVAANADITLTDVTVDGGAVWSGEVNEYLLRGTTNEGLTTGGAIIAASSKSNIILGEGAVLQNNDGANAVNLGTRIGATLTLNGGEIINNHSAAGAIWGGGAITINSGKVNGNHGGIGGAIRVATNVGTVLTMNGGEMNHNISDGVGGAIWAGSSPSNNTYVFNGGEMAYNYSPSGGGAMYAGNYETVKIGGTFKMHDNEAPLAGAIRFGDHASLVMTGGEIYDNGDNPIFLYNNSASITGGTIVEDFGYSGGLGLTIGEANIEGVLTYNLGTNHNTAYLAANFNGFKFKVTEGTANFAAFNFKPAADYVYTEGDEDKLVCMNEGYKTYWDADKGVFKIKIYVESVTIEKPVPEIYVGEEYKLNITVVAGADKYSDYELTSSNEAVATVGADGTIKAIAGGTTTITVISKYDATKSDTVEVQIRTYGDTVYDESLASGTTTLTETLNTAESTKHYNGNREFAIMKGKDYTVNLNGNGINHHNTYQDGKNTGYTYLYTVVSEAKLTINGPGVIDSKNEDGYVSIVYAQGTGAAEINGGEFYAHKGIAIWAGGTSHFVINGGSFISDGSNDQELIYSSGGVIDIYGGFFHNKAGGYTLNVRDANKNTAFINVYGGTYVNYDPSAGSNDPNNIKVAEGYTVISEEQENGDIWYKVVKYVPATEFSADKTAFELEKGATAKFNVTLEPADITYSNITMTSSDDTIATVDAEGNITAVANGTAVITVSTDDPDLAPIEITVKVYTVTSDYDFLMENKGHSGECTLDGDMYADDYIFFGNGTDVTLDLNGNTIEAGNKNQYSMVVQQGGTLRLTGDGELEAGKGFYTNKGNAELIIDDGTYNFTNTGTLNNMKHCSVAQNNSKMVINGGTFTTDVEDAALFFATSNAVIEINGGFFENTADKTPDLLSMGANRDSTNRIILKGGTFVNYNPLEDRMCYTGSWEGVSYEQFAGPWMLVWEGYTVVAEEQANGDIWYSVVEHIPLEEITVDKTDIRLLVGETDKITAGIIPADATHNKLTYTSSDESVATVDAQGNITAISRGKVTITVAEKNDKKQTVVTVKVEEPDPVDSYPVYTVEELKAAIEAGETFIALKEDFEITESIVIPAGADVTIYGKGNTIARADGGEAVAMISVAENAKITLEDVIVDGGAVWSGEVDATLGRGTENTGVATTGAIIVAANNSAIVLGEGAVLQNNDGAYAVNLGTRIGATLTLNGGEIINNNSGSGAIWGGGNIVINSGKINSNSSTGLAGAIRMVSNCNLTMNGGEINNNKATTNGGAIWGYGASTYNFNGGEMAYNSGAVGGAIYTGEGSVINISGDFELHNNTGTEGGAVRFTNRTTLNMTGGKIYDNTSTNSSNWDAFYGWNIAANIKGGEISDDFTLDSGLYCTLGAADITGVVHFALNTTHNTALLTSDFKGFEFTVANGDNFAAFNLDPADGYVYTEGDEDKLVCLNEGYKTYWDADKGVFKIKEYADLFVDELVEGGEIVLEADVVLSETVKIENETKIDLNGKTLSVDKLLLAADTTIEGGKLIQSEPEIREEYGYVLQQNCPFTVESGTLTLINTTVEIDTPGTLSINNNSVIETVGINVKGGKVVIENSDIVVKNDRAYGNLLQYEGVFGVIIDSGELTMKDSSLTIEGIGARDGNDYIAILGGKSADVKSVNLENVQISCAQFYAFGSGKNLTVNTNADAREWAGKYVNCTVNFGA